MSRSPKSPCLLRWSALLVPAFIGGSLLSAAAAALPPPAPVWSVAFSPDGKSLAAGSYKRVQLWDPAAKAVVQTLSGPIGPVRCLTWSADGRQLAAGGGKPGEQGEVRVWTVPAGGAAAGMGQAAALTEHADVVEGVSFAPSGEVVLSAGLDEKALAVQLGSRKVLRTLGDHTNRVTSVSFSPNGKYVATGSLDRTVKIWSGTDFAPLANLDNNNGGVFTVAFLPDGNQFAAAGEDGNVRVYRLTESRSGNTTGLSGSVARTLGGNRTPVFALAVSPKGDFIAWGGADKTVNVSDLRNGNRKYQLKESPDAIYSLAISPDGTLLAAGCRDGKIRLWTLADGKPAGELQ